MTGTVTETAIDFERLFNETPVPLMVLDHELRFIAANDSYLEMTARKRGDLIGRFVFDAFPEAEDRVAVTDAAFRKALAGETTTLGRIAFAIRGRDGGIEDSWWDCKQQPARSADGSIIGVLQHARNVSREMAAERMRDAISDEYDHRVRNLLSKVSAIARRTARATDSMQQFIDNFDPRIMAMARAHQLLVEGGWDRIDLTELIRGELAPYDTPKSPVHDAIHVAGPAVILSSRVAQALGMALHELATNAVKYGALGRRGGQLDVNWSVDASTGAVQLIWLETGVPGTEKPRSSGFGSTIIDRILPSEIGGTVVRDFTGQGLICSSKFRSRPRPDRTRLHRQRHAAIDARPIAAVLGIGQRRPRKQHGTGEALDLLVMLGGVARFFGTDTAGQVDLVDRHVMDQPLILHRDRRGEGVQRRLDEIGQRKGRSRRPAPSAHRAKPARSGSHHNSDTLRATRK